MYMWSPTGIRPGPATQWVWEEGGFGFRPTACFIPAQQRPGFIDRFVAACQRPASFRMRMSRAFSAPDGFWGREPRALPWAGMNDAFGVSI